MKTHWKIILLAGILLPSISYGAKEYTILKINSEEIPYSHVETIWKKLFAGKKAPDFESFNPEVKKNVLRGIVSEHLIHQQAMNSDIASRETITEAVEQFRERLIIETFLKEKTEKELSEKKLKAHYNKKIKETKGEQEIRARHILLKTEKEANKLKKELEDGKHFARTARIHSLDKANAAQGGELGYFTKGVMDPAFTKAAFALPIGKVSDPVKTDFGWHLILVEDKRPINQPSFEEAKPAIKETLQKEAINNYIAHLVDTAKVTYYDRGGKKLEFTRTPDSTNEKMNPKEEPKKENE